MENIPNVGDRNRFKCWIRFRLKNSEVVNVNPDASDLEDDARHFEKFVPSFCLCKSFDLFHIGLLPLLCYGASSFHFEFYWSVANPILLFGSLELNWETIGRYKWIKKKCCFTQRIGLEVAFFLMLFFEQNLPSTKCSFLNAKSLNWI